jgi:hypothetical protein
MRRLQLLLMDRAQYTRAHRRPPRENPPSLSWARRPVIATATAANLPLVSRHGDKWQVEDRPGKIALFVQVQKDTAQRRKVEETSDDGTERAAPAEVCRVPEASFAERANEASEPSCRGVGWARHRR